MITPAWAWPLPGSWERRLWTDSGGNASPTHLSPGLLSSTAGLPSQRGKRQLGFHMSWAGEGAGGSRALTPRWLSRPRRIFQVSGGISLSLSQQVNFTSRALERVLPYAPTRRLGACEGLRPWQPAQGQGCAGLACSGDKGISRCCLPASLTPQRQEARTAQHCLCRLQPS